MTSRRSCTGMAFLYPSSQTLQWRKWSHEYEWGTERVLPRREYLESVETENRQMVEITLVSEDSGRSDAEILSQRYEPTPRLSHTRTCREVPILSVPLAIAE